MALSSIIYSSIGIFGGAVILFLVVIAVLSKTNKNN